MDPKQAVETFNFVQPLLFWLVAALISVCAIATVVSQNIVRAATWLLFTLAGTSGLFFLLGADLVGAVQLLVYVGGTLVLVVFGVMLTAQGPFINMKPSGAEWAISVVAGALLMAVLTTGIVSDRALGARFYEPVAEYAPKKARSQVATDPATSSQSATLGEGFLGVGVGPAHKVGKDGPIVRMNYLLPFELVSVHLLVVLIGAAYLARAKRRRGVVA
jgi:NADH:ubiquinone oxidoreductase subunit 6 (subunit J)